MNNTLHKRTRRKIRTRTIIQATAKKPRMAVRKSLKNVYVQVIDDSKGLVLAAASYKDVKGKSNSRMEKSALLGEVIAKKCIEKKIDEIVFDRGQYKYHGHIKAVADGARIGGLKF